MTSPTHELYQPLTNAYEHFNQYLFDSELPPVIFTLQRKKHVAGFFAAQRWGNKKGKFCSEIAINPAYFAESRLIEVMQTLVHEMVHVWQHHFGTPSERHYHNTEWAQKMISVGLMPSVTGEPGGAITGQHMSDYIIKEGAFLRVAMSLIEESRFELPWFDRLAMPKLREPVIADFNAQTRTADNENLEQVVNMSSGATTETLEHYFTHEVDHQVEGMSDSLPNNFYLSEVARKPTRFKYTCPGCDTKVYGKQGLNLICGECKTRFAESD